MQGVQGLAPHHIQCSDHRGFALPSLLLARWSSPVFGYQCPALNASLPRHSLVASVALLRAARGAAWCRQLGAGQGQAFCSVSFMVSPAACWGQALEGPQHAILCTAASWHLTRGCGCPTGWCRNCINHVRVTRGMFTAEYIAACGGGE